MPKAKPLVKVPTPAVDPSIKSLKDKLYDACVAKHTGQYISQNQLLALKIIPNDNIHNLTACVNLLLNEHLLTLLLDDGVYIYRVNRREDGHRYKQLSVEESLVFSSIESAGRSGLWTRTIKTRTNLHQAVMARSIKILEQKGMIKPVINIENPTRKIYIVSTLQPAEEMTGGPWYNDDGTGELDEEFIHVLSAAAHEFITSRSFVIWRGPTHRGTKRNAAGQTKEESIDAVRRIPGTAAIDYLPMPAGFQYPSLKDIKRHLNGLGVTGVTIDDHAMEQLLDVLMFDGKIEKVSGGTAYKAVKERIDGSTQAGTGNGLTEAPCGTCPVFDLCEEGGPVSASSCKYFARWLEI